MRWISAFSVERTFCLLKASLCKRATHPLHFHLLSGLWFPRLTICIYRISLSRDSTLHSDVMVPAFRWPRLLIGRFVALSALASNQKLRKSRWSCSDPFLVFVVTGSTCTEKKAVHHDMYSTLCSVAEEPKICIYFVRCIFILDLKWVLRQITWADIWGV